VLSTKRTSLRLLLLLRMYSYFVRDRASKCGTIPAGASGDMIEGEVSCVPHSTRTSTRFNINPESRPKSLEPECHDPPSDIFEHGRNQ